MCSLFTGLITTVGILWIPSLADITSFLSFALRIKSFIDYYLSFLPGNFVIPIPEWLKKKISFGFNLEYFFTNTLWKGTLYVYRCLDFNNLFFKKLPAILKYKIFHSLKL